MGFFAQRYWPARAFFRQFAQTDGIAKRFPAVAMSWRFLPEARSNAKPQLPDCFAARAAASPSPAGCFALQQRAKSRGGEKVEIALLPRRAPRFGAAQSVAVTEELEIFRPAPRQRWTARPILLNLEQSERISRSRGRARAPRCLGSFPADSPDRRGFQ
jgi:hypothetical protein